MRAVVSISLAPELAAELHSEAEQRGRSFSEHVRRVLELGRAVQALVDLADAGKPERL